MFVACGSLRGETGRVLAVDATREGLHARLDRYGPGSVRALRLLDSSQHACPQIAGPIPCHGCAAFAASDHPHEEPFSGPCEGCQAQAMLTDWLATNHLHEDAL